jgi:hypothetical protein
MTVERDSRPDPQGPGRALPSRNPDAARRLPQCPQPPRPADAQAIPIADPRFDHDPRQPIPQHRRPAGASWRSNTVIDGIDATCIGTPASASRSRAGTASDTSEPLAMIAARARR